MERRKRIRIENRDPRRCHVFIDANALDRVNDARSIEVERFKSLQETLAFSCVVPDRVREELADPRTPVRTKLDSDGIYTIPVHLNPLEAEQRSRLRNLLRGNAKSEKHEADADHIFEASKYGGGYFITHDKRILRTLASNPKIVPNVKALTLAEFIAVCENLIHSKS